MSNITEGIHVGIIPDGNRRWAKKRGLAVFEGHKFAGEHTLPNLLDSLERFNINVCTLWVLSPENFKRPKIEIDNILKMIETFLDTKRKLLHNKKIRFVTIGSTKHLTESLRNKIKEVSEETKKYEDIIFCCAIDYGGRDEIVRACEKVRKKFKNNIHYSVDLIAQYLDTAKLGDPDLIIRTGGEKRLSGFMLWQNEYSELYFTDILFPDFTQEEFKKAIDEFYTRKRRYGR